MNIIKTNTLKATIWRNEWILGNRKILTCRSIFLTEGKHAIKVRLHVTSVKLERKQHVLAYL